MKLSFNRAFDYWLKNKKKPPAFDWTLSIIWLFLICWLAFLWNLGSTGLVDETEPLFAEAARQMTVTGDWIVPFFNGETRFDKPILIYWLIAIAYKILGVNSWAVRLPSALSAIALVCLGFYTLWSFGIGADESQPEISSYANQTHRYWLCAALGSALIALNPETIVWARIGASDMLLTGCIGGALLSFFIAYAQPSKPRLQGRWYLIFYVLIALGILTKGPVAIVLPGLIIGTFLFYLGNGREVLQEMRPLWGGFLILSIALPWYVLVIWRSGWAYINSFFGYHNIERFTNVVNRHSAPWYFYFLVVLIGFAPWSIYLPMSIARLKFWQRAYWSSSHRSTQLGLFALFWFICIFGFFTIATTKLPSYILPLMPAAAILVALNWSEQLDRVRKTKSKHERKNSFFFWSNLFNVVFLLALAGALFYSPNFINKDPAIVNPRQVIEQSGLPILGSAIWGVTGVAVLVVVWQRKSHKVLSINLLGFLAFLIFVLIPANLLMDRSRQLPLRQLSAIVTQVEQPGEPLIMVGFKKPSVAFYTQRSVQYISSSRAARSRIEKQAIAQPQPPTLIILSQPKKFEQMGLNPHRYQNLGMAGTYQLIRISKSELSTSRQQLTGN